MTAAPEPAPLTPFGPDIWLADGPAVTAAAGFRYPTRMAVIRLSQGGLFLRSPVPPTPGLRAAIDALGPVRHIVAPNALHHLFWPTGRGPVPLPGCTPRQGCAPNAPICNFMTSLTISRTPAGPTISTSS